MFRKGRSAVLYLEHFRAIVLIEVWGGRAQERSPGAFPDADAERAASIREVLLSLAQVSKTGAFFPVIGQCDIVGILEATSMEDIYKVVRAIRYSRGVRLTTTLPVVQASPPRPTVGS